MAFNNAEGGTNGVTVTAANSGGASGTAWDTVLVGDATATLIYDTTHPAEGTLGYKFQLGSVATEDYLQWLTSFTTSDVQSALISFYLYWTANPAAAIYQCRAASAAGTSSWGVKIDAAAKLAVYDAGGSLVTTMATAIPLNETVRVDIQFQYNSPTSGTVKVGYLGVVNGASDKITGTVTTPVPISRIRLGHTGTGIANVGPWWMDLLQATPPDRATVPLDTYLPDTAWLDVGLTDPLGDAYQPPLYQTVEVVGGTTFFANVDGTITPAGALVRQTNKPLAGTATPAGALTKQTGKTLVGSATPAGALIRSTAKTLTGSITPSGVLTTSLVKLLTLAGSLTPAGALIRQTRKTLAGPLTPAGTLVRATAKTVTGSITPAGTLLRQTGKRLTGTLTPSGSLVRVTTKILAGIITPAGAIAKRVNKSLAGSLSPSGAALKLVSKLLGGAITPAGTVDPSILGPTVDITATARALPPAFAHALRQSTTGEAMPAPAGHAIGPTATAAAVPTGQGRGLE